MSPTRRFPALRTPTSRIRDLGSCRWRRAIFHDTFRSQRSSFSEPGYFAEAFFRCGSLQAGGHVADCFFGNHVATTSIALDADIERHVEKQRFQFAIVAAGQAHVGSALPA